MTYREYVLRKHPEAFDPRHKDLMKGCPSDYGLEVNCGEMNDCKECWNAEIQDQQSEQKLKVAVLAGAIVPRREHKNDAGLDLFATKGGWIFPKSRKVFRTGFHASIPAGFVGLLTSKSGMMLKGITSRGTIDSDYTGEIRAVLFNHSWKFIRIKPNQKITQLVILPIITPELELVDSLDDTERGEGGFGSTGKF